MITVVWKCGHAKSLPEGLHTQIGERGVMIIIAHRLTAIEACDHVYRVENQKIVEEWKSFRNRNPFAVIRLGTCKWSHYLKNPLKLSGWTHIIKLAI